MVIAWINYVNLATTRAIERAKEVGIRKVVGASRGQLVGQFMTESVLLNLAAMVFAITLVQLVQPYFNGLAGESLSIRLLLGQGYGGWYATLTLGAVIVAGVLASGAYPAFTLSAYEPVKVLKGKSSNSGKGILLRKSLVVFQYAVSVALIAGTFAIYHQIRYMTGKDLGFQTEQTLVVYGPSLTSGDSTYTDRANSLKEEVKRLAAVKAAATSSMLPGDRGNRWFGLQMTGSNTNLKISSSWLFVDYEFIPTLGIKMLAGRDFRRTDHTPNKPDMRKVANVVINRKLAQLLGFNEVQMAIHRKVTYMGWELDIIGVMENFHQQSLREALEPVIFLPSYRTGNFYSFKVSPDQLPQTIARIEETYLKFFPGNTFEYFFLEEKFNRQYKGEMTFGRLTVTFSLLTIFIACLGLFGLAILATAQRTKEIGVRKVLGASLTSLLLLLSKDFIRLILLANLIAWPLAFLGIREWLANYAFQIDMSPWLFVLPTLLVLLIALLTVSTQTWKAARSNPVNSLRYE
jgi:putative ABC transport system permease protein